MHPVSFIFVGRISFEKGVHLIFQATEELVEKGYTNFHIDFVGSGILVETLTRHHLYGTHLLYHGRLPKEQTMARMSKADYTLMPSLFLETFGLVALDSLAFGIPVIGEKKGGLSPFIIDDHLVIDKHQSLLTCMQYVLDHASETYTDILRQKAFQVASAYTTREWVDKFGQLSNNCKNCFLVSDYARDIGGIENYLFQVKNVLSERGVVMQLYGKIERVTGWWRKIDLLTAGLNCGAARDIYKKITNEQFDLIRLHSVQRRLGRCSLAVIGRFKKSPVWCMYHDFGLLHPFPSAVYTLDQLDRCDSFFGYMAEGKHVVGSTKRYLGGVLLVGAKYMYSAWLFCWLHKTVDVHLVPSAYLLPYLQKKLPFGAKIEVFSHFVSHARDV